MLETFMEVYFEFVIERSENAAQIEAVFVDLQKAMNGHTDIEVLRACYAVYAEVLASELIRIRCIHSKGEYE